MSQGYDETGFDAFSMDDVDPDRPGSGGGGMLPEGGYCVLITEVAVKNERGSTQIECEVVAAKDDALVGRKYIEYLKWPKPEYSEVGNRIAKEQLLAWCYATQTTSPEEIKQRQQARQGFSPAWLESMVGRKCLIVVKHESYKNASGDDKESAKVEGRVWSLDNPKAKGIPGWTGAPAAGSGFGGAATPPVNPVEPPATEAFDGLV